MSNNSRKWESQCSKMILLLSMQNSRSIYYDDATEWCLIGSWSNRKLACNMLQLITNNIFPPHVTSLIKLVYSLVRFSNYKAVSSSYFCSLLCTTLRNCLILCNELGSHRHDSWHGPGFVLVNGFIVEVPCEGLFLISQVSSLLWVLILCVR